MEDWLCQISSLVKYLRNKQNTHLSTFFSLFQVLSNTTDMAQFYRTASGIAAYEGLLQIRSVKQVEFGNYECEVVNKFGSDQHDMQLSPKCKIYTSAFVNVLKISMAVLKCHRNKLIEWWTAFVKKT